MCTADKSVEDIGSECPDPGKVLSGSRAGSLTVWVRDMDNVTTHWEDFGQIPPHDGLHTDKE